MEFTDDAGGGGGQFTINGLEIDLDELDALERKVADKRQRQQQTSDPSNQSSEAATSTAAAEAPDYLDEYLERLQISRDSEPTKTDTLPSTSSSSVTSCIVPKPPSTANDSVSSRVIFLRLLLMFMSIMSMAKLLNKNYDGNDLLATKLLDLCF